tara:strand:+ start:47 stop:625 length:579 start_codon:yes stop_codon:yes gene_type:complete
MDNGLSWTLDGNDYHEFSRKQAVKEFGEDFVKKTEEQYHKDFRDENTERAGKLFQVWTCISQNLQYRNILMGIENTAEDVDKQPTDGQSLARVYFSQLSAAISMELQEAFGVDRERLTFEGKQKVVNILSTTMDLLLFVGALGSLTRKDVEFEQNFLKFEEQSLYMHRGVKKSGRCICHVMQPEQEKGGENN